MNYLAYLHSIWITHKKFFEIFESHNDYKWFFENISDLSLSKYYDNDQISKILQSKKDLNLENIDKIIKKLDIKIISIFDEKYPTQLKNISNKPYFFYLRWNIYQNDEFFWVVWSRNITSYWKKAWEKIIWDLVNYFTIVSGGAGWCDTLAHQIAVDNNKKTLVVFGTWIDKLYPSTNWLLFEKVIENNWWLISIFPIWTPGWIYTFPIRNEIVSGLSKWILVLQASVKSGTLITANMALDQWKDLFAIPWDIFHPWYEWTNNLIKNWNAKLVTDSKDILEEYNYSLIKNEVVLVFENDIQKDIYNILKYNLSLSIDEIIEKTNIDYGNLIINLSMMELWWLLKKDLFWKYWI